MRLTEKNEKGTYDFNPSNFSYDLSNYNEELDVVINKLLSKLGQLEDLMEKYGFETVEDLDNFIQSCINRIEYEIKKEKLL